eukprot:TRINITY_DN91941_c0_g1_i1.p1 TRINITY_DN91941_c0_g1~~TRINITY_DN91941_c0_g1_i1.p1  ORF type:complete len:187 (+),score=18.64 TRINITY_DN91941_c0_g1_i1:102-662(+)
MVNIGDKLFYWVGLTIGSIVLFSIGIALTVWGSLTSTSEREGGSCTIAANAAYVCKRSEYKPRFSNAEFQGDSGASKTCSVFFLQGHYAKGRSDDEMKSRCDNAAKKMQQDLVRKCELEMESSTCLETAAASGQDATKWVCIAFGSLFLVCACGLFVYSGRGLWLAKRQDKGIELSSDPTQIGIRE